MAGTVPVDEFKAAIEAAEKSVALATHGIKALGSVMRGNLIGAMGETAKVLAFFGPAGKVASAGLEIVSGAIESLWKTALATTAKFNPGLVEIYKDAMDDLNAAIGEGLYPIIREVIPYLRTMADVLHNNAGGIRSFTSTLFDFAAGAIGAKFALQQAQKSGPQNSSYGLAAQQAGYSDLFEAGDKARLKIASQQATGIDKVAENGDETNDLLRGILENVSPINGLGKVLENLQKTKEGRVTGEEGS